jgi:hypothetical protein
MQIVAIISRVIVSCLGIIFLFATQIITGLSLSVVVSSACLTACLEIRFINNSKSSNAFISCPLTTTRSLLKGAKLISLQSLTCA